jgi:hypothetical protein
MQAHGQHILARRDVEARGELQPFEQGGKQLVERPGRRGQRESSAHGHQALGWDIAFTVRGSKAGVNNAGSFFVDLACLVGSNHFRRALWEIPRHNAPCQRQRWQGFFVGVANTPHNHHRVGVWLA